MKWLFAIPLTALVATITLAGDCSASFDFALSPAPGPGRTMLLGAGLFLLAVWGKRRKNV